jgi:hypothetical protein
MKPICITFAGPLGCSKSPVAQFLACELGWPLFANDVVRNEVREDQLQPELDQQEYADRVVTRIKDLASRNQSLIYDASNDRHWDKLLQNFEPDQYRFAVISFDLSEGFYRELLQAKNYALSETQTTQYIADHNAFLERTDIPIIHRITDENFAKRLDTSLQAVQTFLDAT